MNNVLEIPPSLEIMKAAAVRGGDEDWAYIDKNKAEVARLPETVAWIWSAGLDERYYGLRDLAATFVEEFPGPLRESIACRSQVLHIIETDPSEPVRVRLSHAMWDCKDRSTLVRNVLLEAARSSTIPELKKIGEQCLGQ